MSTYTALEMVLPGKCHHMARSDNTSVLELARVGTDTTSRNLEFWLAAAGPGVTDDQVSPRHPPPVAGVCPSRAAQCQRGLPLLPVLAGPGQDLPHRQGGRRLLAAPQVLLTDRDPVRWYHSVNNTILQATQMFMSPSFKYNPLMQLMLKLSGRDALTRVPEVGNLSQYHFQDISICFHC